MADACEYCGIPIQPETRCRYQRHVMASGCTAKHQWLLQREYFNEVHPDPSRPQHEVTERSREEVRREYFGDWTAKS
jgi:hypothetical protein